MIIGKHLFTRIKNEFNEWHLYVNELKLNENKLLATGNSSDVFIKSVKLAIHGFVDDK